jgi:DNA-directed RNA polymerase specialized sigma24 family protein
VEQQVSWTNIEDKGQRGFERGESALIAKRAVWAALDLLRPRRRAIVIMHELERMSAAAIASFLGVSGMTVRWHLSMGRHDLKRVLKPQMGDTI